ncbi:Secreted effector protein pipB2 [Legionella birminghamensis]|uniref:Secreted effector protein pipB2 n=1 Tax=Legionella birminghamensis TaxID=28083 RepID=A0A378IB97_9GAMM|nr:DUF2169 domain-containing protein [Legionella birminghamensis]KTC71654.1 Secreted effector protein pipB2 [Legionella birminghamensis]STX32507.1 Type III effector pipB2 [Legionella birminghamensis]
MKILRDASHTLIPVFYRHNNKDMLSVTLMAMFSFNQRKIFSSFQEFWTIAKKNFQDDEMLDFYLPKLRSEYFVKGSCYAYDPETRQSEVEIILADMEKKLLVFGERHWIIKGLVRQASKPAVFESMPLSYENAFGGKENPYNPQGKGDADSQKSGHDELPNIEIPNHLVTESSARPLPALLLPYPLDAKAFKSKLGTFDRDWYEKERPFYPKDIDWSYFNRALPDQQRDGFFSGDENFSIKNMHPGKKIINGSLPGMRMRCFYKHQDEQAKLEEIALQLDTVWLMPEYEKGILIWHGQIALSPAGKKPAFIHSAHEFLDTPKKPLEYYATRLKNPPIEILPPAPLHGVKSSAKLGVGTDLAEQLKKIRVQKEEDPDTAKLRIQLASLLNGLSPNAQIAVAKSFSSQMIEELKLNKAEPSSQATKQLFSNIAKYKEEIVKGDKPDSEKQKLLKEADLIEKRIRMLDATGKMAQYRLKAASPSTYTREDIIKAYQDKTDLKYENLSGLDLSGLDLSGIDLSGCNLSHCLLVETKFNHANLEQATLMNARLEKTTLVTANLSAALFRNCQFSQVEGKSANLSKAELLECQFEACDFSNAALVHAKISHSRFNQVQLVSAKAEAWAVTDCTFKACDLSKAAMKYSHIDRCFFEQVELSEADFTNSDCRHSQFEGLGINQLTAKLCVMKNCKLTNCLFDYCQMDSFELIQSHFEKSRFLHCQMEKISIAGTTIVNSRIAHSNLKNCRTNADTQISKTKFLNTELNNSALLGGQFDNISCLACNMENMQIMNSQWLNAEFVQCNGKRLRILDSEMKRIDFKKTNLFQGYFQNSRFIESEFDHCNLYAATFNTCTLMDTPKRHCLEQQSYYDEAET